MYLASTEWMNDKKSEAHLRIYIGKINMQEFNINENEFTQITNFEKKINMSYGL